MFYRTSLLALSALTATVLSAAVLAAPRAAQAATIALTPMLTESSLAPEDRAGVYQVLSSELDFSPEVDKVVELTEVPRGLDDWCLTNARCLEAIAIEHDAHGLVTGRLTARGSTYVLDVVYFQGGRIVRRKAFTVPRDPTALANSMNPVVRELLTGVDPRAEARQEATVDDFELDHDELEVAQGTPTESLVDEDVFAFDFGAANRGDISVAEMSEERAEPNAHSASGVVPGVVGGASEQAAEPDPDRLARTRGPRQPPARTSGRTENRSATRAATRSPGPARSAARLPRRQEEVARNVRLAVRGGYSNYYAFDFVTGGIEGAVRLGQGRRAARRGRRDVRRQPRAAAAHPDRGGRVQRVGPHLPAQRRARVPVRRGRLAPLPGRRWHPRAVLPRRGGRGTGRAGRASAWAWTTWWWTASAST